jgi:aspartyl-tRNA(Asn)/glutamyl-tRNA(Gln) amidotransferase subunit B
MSGATDAFEMVVGLEVHVQLKTETKIFCGCSTNFGASPNANTCPVCLGLPGALPVLNARAVELAVRTGHALRCTVNPVSVFARKNYFYPDLPKGYQISQFDRPLARGGRLQIGVNANGGAITIGITRVHMEEDAGKSIHDRYASVTAIDLNRAGVPLVEIVSEPEMRSSTEAAAYLKTLKQVLEYARVSDVSMEEGSLRVDANISIRKRGETSLGTKTEIKNMNSFSAVERALEVEFARQCEILSSGGRVEQQTVLWDGATVKAARSKEGSHDYRYFPEPDLPPLILEREYIDRIQEEMPELPAARRARMEKDYPRLSAYDLDVLTASRGTADYFEHVARAHGDGKLVANWVLGEVAAAVKAADVGIDHFPVRPRDLAALLDMVRDDAITNTAAKKIFGVMLATGDPPATIAGRDGLLKVSDDSRLREWVDAVLAEHPDEARRFLAGEKKLQGVLVGFVMRKSGGSADPSKVNQLLAERTGT